MGEAQLLAAAVLGERPSLIQLGGAVLVCCGVLAASRAAAQRRGGMTADAEQGFDDIFTPSTDQWR